MSPMQAEQFSYHLLMAATWAISGDTAENVAETTLAWSILSLCCPNVRDAAGRVAADLTDPSRVLVSKSDREQARVRAQDLALSLEAHYTSVGQHDQATLYESLVEELDSSFGAIGRV
jgi:hypothetical protein